MDGRLCRVKETALLAAPERRGRGAVRITLQDRADAVLAVDLPLDQALKLLGALREIELAISLGARSREDAQRALDAARAWV